MEAILIVGNTRALGLDEVRRTAERFRVTMASLGEERDEEKNRLDSFTYHHVGNNLDGLTALFPAKSFTAVWYVSESVDEGRYDPKEPERVVRVLRECAQAHVDKLVLLTSLEGQRPDSQLSADQQIAALGLRQMEEMASHAAGDAVRLVVLRLPQLVGTGADTLLGRLAAEGQHEAGVTLAGTPESHLELLSTDDLLPLLWYVTNEHDDVSAAYPVVSGFAMTYQDLADVLASGMPDVPVAFGGARHERVTPARSPELRAAYGFVAVRDPLQQARQLLERRASDARSPVRGASRLVRVLADVARRTSPYPEIVVLFLLSELASAVTAHSVYFQVVDVRLAFLVAVATAFGLRFGLLAAALECAMALIAYQGDGVGLLTVLFNASYWVPLVTYLAVGSVCGYVSDAHREQLAGKDLELARMRDRLLVLQYAYEESLANQDSYRRQIWSFTDSYGKVARLVKALDRPTVAEVCDQCVQVLEEALDVRQVSVYQLDGEAGGARAVSRSTETPACSEELSAADLASYLASCDEHGVWVNRDFDERRPFFVCRAGDPQRGDTTGPADEPAFLLALWEGETEHMTTWFTNKFRLLGEIAGIFLRNAQLQE